jgi:hypothetical protein
MIESDHEMPKTARFCVRLFVLKHRAHDRSSIFLSEHKTMTIRPTHQITALLTLAAALAAPAYAAPTFFRGVDSTAGGVMPTTGPAVAARNSFVAAITDLASEQFEGASTGVPPGNSLSVFSGGGTLTQATGAAGRIENVVSPNGPGRFNTTPAPACAGAGCKWWETSRTFEVVLSSSVSAFGFYGTDLGDAGGSLTLDFWDGANSVRSGVAVDNSGERGITFFGYVDDALKFNRVTFNLRQTQTDPDLFDFMGFDSVLKGNLASVPPPPPPVPEPASLALVALSLGLLAASRRRRG